MILNEKVWVVLRPNYVDGILKTVGICGTGFFIEPNKFITAWHICNEKSFSQESVWNNDHLIIVSPSGEQEKVFLNQCTFSKDKDITYIKINKNYPTLEKEYCSLNEEVYSVGYPTKDLQSLISDNLSIKDQRKNEGKIITIEENYSVIFNNGNIINKKVIMVDYLSEEGYSGGPLFNKNNKVLGLMSNIDPAKKMTLVVSCEEF
ncbi:MAG: serine protease [Candidatus Paceibacterota bacterium]